MTSIKNWMSNRFELALANDRNKAVNIMEFGGELWVSFFGEPVVPISLIKEDVDVVELMERCRNGWSDFKRSEK